MGDFMKKTRYLLWVLFAELAGALSGLLSRSGMEEYSLYAQKPPLSPPEWLFAPVWVLLYGLMGVGAARIDALPEGKGRSRGLNLFVAQLVVNFFWSPIFFNAQAYGAAFFWLLLLLTLAAAMTAAFYREDRLAGLLQIPYLLWLSFAAYLNYAVWQLNK